MRRGSIVVVVGRSVELDLALGALEVLDLGLRVIPTLAEAEWALLSRERPMVGAVLISLVEEPGPGLGLIRALRARPGLADVPIVAWAQETAAGTLAEAYGAGVSSGVLLDGSDNDAVRLAQTIHYWAAANEPAPLESVGVSTVPL